MADQNRVKITAKPYGHQPGPTELCPMAGAATDHVVAVLGRGGAIPRRPTAPNAASLATMDACQRLESNALTRVLNPPVSKLLVRLAFDRDRPLTPADGRRLELGGHEVYIKPETDELDEQRFRRCQLDYVAR